MDLEKVTNEISAIVSNCINNPIKSISILFDPNDPPYVLEKGHFGISRQIIKDVTLMIYKDLNSCKKKCLELPVECYDTLNVLQVLNPDDYKLYNLKREFLSQRPKFETDFIVELCYSSLPLKIKPKSHEPFKHKKWLLSENQKFLNSEVIKNELQCCAEAATLYKNNYYAWTHRLWVVQNFSKEVNFIAELEWSRIYIKSNVSDFSGMNYRFNFLVLSNQDRSLFIKEVDVCMANIMFYKCHEALWCYLKLLISYCKSKGIRFDELCLLKVCEMKEGEKFRLWFDKFH